jgi:hypothetical protein
MTPDELWDVSLFAHTLAPRLDDRGTLRCPRGPVPLDDQELTGMRAMLASIAVGEQPLIAQQ